MTRRLWSGLVAVMAGAGFSVAEEPPLPSWRENEQAELESKGWALGALLLPDEAAAEESAKAVEELRNAEKPTAEDIANDLKTSPEIPEKFMAAYFAERPKTFLVDPQGLLSPSEYRDRLHFLNDHSSDSTIDLFVYLIGGEQDIPSAVREEEVIERFFSTGRPATVIYYYLGAPQRSSVYLSPSMTDQVSAAQQRRALESSVQHAFARTEPAEQFEKFLVQMSIRVYWMEPKSAALPAVTALPEPAPRDEKTTGKTAKFEWLVDWLKAKAILIGGVSLTLLLGWGLHRWLRARARYEFPVFDIEPRLGGPHAAGVGAVISFANAALPPALQRDQVPDYLRRA